MILETKFDESFPSGQSLMDNYSFFFHFDRYRNGGGGWGGGGILLCRREDIPSKLLSVNQNIEGIFFV